MVTCVVCSNEFSYTPVQELFCSKHCYFSTLKVPVRTVWERDNQTCHICGDPVSMEEASRDHLVPRAHGGPTTFENVALAHKLCNSRRGTREIHEVKAAYGKPVVQGPGEPTS